MKKYLIMTALAAILTALPGCSPATMSAGPPPKVDNNVKNVAQSNNSFAIDLYEKLKENEGNLFFSPSSISTALAMTCAGARGKTADEMKTTLRFTLDDKTLHPAMGNLAKFLTLKQKGCTLSIANALWGQKGYNFLQEFLDLVKKSSGAGLNEVDFAGATEQARKIINAWIEEKTNNKIKELIKPGVLKPLTRLVLTNAIHFKGTWKKQFKKNETLKAKFHLTRQKSVQAKMMHMRKEKFKYLKGDDFQALELPYTGDNLSMLIFLPDKVDGLAKFEKKLTGENLKNWTSRIRSKKIDLLAIPRFKMTCEFSLANTLKELGMVSAFSMDADFSGMNGRKDLFISAVIHKAFVDVNEEGTEAAAATGVVIKLKSVAPRRTIFRVDHPFLFVIRDNRTGAILFMGRVTNPAS